MKKTRKTKEINSKEFFEILNKIKEERIRKNKENKEKKSQKKSIDDIIKTKNPKRKKTQASFNSYFRGFGTNTRYRDFSAYDTKKIDYESLYSYLGSGVKSQFSQGYEIRNQGSDELGEKEILSSEQVDTILRKTVMSEMLKTSLDNISIEEKEKFHYYKQLNRIWVMVKYDLLGLGNYA